MANTGGLRLFPLNVIHCGDRLTPVPSFNNDAPSVMNRRIGFEGLTLKHPSARFIHKDCDTRELENLRLQFTMEEIGPREPGPLAQVPSILVFAIMGEALFTGMPTFDQICVSANLKFNPRGIFAILVGFIVWILVYDMHPPWDCLKDDLTSHTPSSTTHRSMSTTHKTLFGSSIIMFLIAVAHLSLLVQHAAIGKILRPAGRAARALALAQVCFDSWFYPGPTVA
jgi:hypothetical protein